MRLVLTLFLSLLFLLLRGDSNLSSHANHNISFHLARHFQRPEQANSVTTKNIRTVIEDATVPGEENEFVNATETEDDELIAPRKYTEISNYFFTFFYSHLSGYFNQYLNNRLPFCKHFSYTSSNKYIVQRVIRV